MGKSKQSEREAAIIKVVRFEGYPLGGNQFLISQWGLARHLNNRWAANLFVGKNFMEKVVYDPGFWAVPNHLLWKFHRMLNWTIKRMEGTSKESFGAYDTNVWYTITIEGSSDAA